MAAAAAAAAQAQQDLDDLRHCMRICGITAQAKINGITVREEIVSLEQFSTFHSSEVKDIFDGFARRRTNTVSYTTRDAKAMKALNWWLRDRVARNLPLTPALWTAAVRRDAEERMYLAENEPDNTTSVSSLNKFDSLNFDVCFDGFSNLMRQKGHGHFVRKKVQPPVFADEEEKRLYELRFDTIEAQNDNRKVFQYLKEYLVDTDAWPWIEKFDKKEDGRGAIIALTDYYNGEGELNKRNAHARATLDSIHFKSEDKYSIEKFGAKAKAAMAVLDKDPDEKMSERQKVTWLQKTITPTDPDLATHVQLFSDKYKEDFDGALAYFSGQVSRVNASVQISARTKGKRRISELETGGRGRGGRGRGRFGGRYGGRGRGRGGRGRGRGRFGRGGRGGGRGGPVMLGNVDVSDPTRTFTDDEYQKLRDGNYWPVVLQMRQARNYNQNPSGEQQRNISGVGTGSEGQQQQQQQQPQQQQQQPNPDRGAQNGSGFGSGAYRN